MQELISNRYQIISTLGEGGMATVYKALDTRLQREVAIKILHPHVAKQSEFCHRFKQEAAIAAKLVHPNVVQVYDYGTHSDGRTFIVSELVRGQDFHILQVEHLKNYSKPFSPVFCAMICTEILKALEAAHAQHFIHRDIKPDNVMISDDGIVKLTDFGIAKSLDTSLTTAGHFLGSPVYASPEQVQSHVVDFRSDLYSVGIILYESLTGRLPFTGYTASEVMMHIVQGKYTNAKEVYPGVPASLDKIICKALNTNIEERFFSTVNMKNELLNFLSNCNANLTQENIALYFQDKNKFDAIFNLEQVAGILKQTKETNHIYKETAAISNVHPKTKRKTKTNIKPIARKNKEISWINLSVFAIAIIAVLLFTLNKVGINKSTLNRISPTFPILTETIPPINSETLSNNISNRTDANPDIILKYTQAPIKVTPKEIIKEIKENAPAIVEPKRVAQTLKVSKKNSLGLVASIKNTSQIAPAKISLPKTPSKTEVNANKVVYGKLIVQTLPGNANIFIDGYSAGISNVDGSIKIPDLKAGKHHLVIRSTEVLGIKYAAEEKDFIIENGKTVNLGIVKLTPYRNLNLFITGPNVILKINNDIYNTNGKPMTLSLQEGDVKIKAKASNGKTFDRTIQLKGDNMSLNVSLE